MIPVPQFDAHGNQVGMGCTATPAETAAAQLADTPNQVATTNTGRWRLKIQELVQANSMTPLTAAQTTQLALLLAKLLLQINPTAPDEIAI